MEQDVAKSTHESLEDTLVRLAVPNISSDALLRQVRELHPDASKKAIIRAAFAAMIAAAERDAEKSLLLQDFALHERGAVQAEEPGESDPSR